MRTLSMYCAISVFLLLSLLSTSAVSQSFRSRSADYGLAVGPWLGGNVSIDNVTVSKKLGFLLHGFADFYLIDKLSMGVYANYSSLSFEEADQTASMYEFGISIKPRILLPGGSVALKPGLEVGYRGESVNLHGVSDVKALAVNLSVECQFKTKGPVIPFAIVGFLAQPAGGNGDVSVTFAPLFFLGGGVAF